MKTKQIVPRHPLTTEESLAIQSLAGVSFPAASWDKRFYRNCLEGALEITDNMAAQLWRIFIRYRRQVRMPDRGMPMLQATVKAGLLKYAAQHAAPDLRKKNP